MTALEFLESIGAHLVERTQVLDMGITLPHPRLAITQALEKTVLCGGKRLRPLLTYIVGSCHNLEFNQMDLFAKSIEQVHAASLAHDDVIDDASKRRGQDSINVLTSNKQAILAGDYLLANVICQLSAFGNLKVVSETAQVISELSEGEWLQMELADKRVYQLNDVINVANYKTASVLKWCCVIAPILAGCQERTVELWRRFGYHLGLSFQFIDDTLDFSGNKEKEALIDLQNGIVNMVLFHWLENHDEIKESYLKGASLETLWSEEFKVDAVEKTRQLAFAHLDRCHELLEEIDSQLANHEDSTIHAAFLAHRKQLETILQFLKLRKN